MNGRYKELSKKWKVKWLLSGTQGIQKGIYSIIKGEELSEKWKVNGWRYRYESSKSLYKSPIIMN